MLVGLVMAGCVTVPEVAYDREASSVQTIALLQPGFPDKPTAFDGAGTQDAMGAAGGLIGSLIGAAIDASTLARREGKLDTALEGTEFNARNQFVDSLVVKLEEQGYSVQILSAGDAARTEHESEPPAAIGVADAVFDVVTTSYGFASTGGQWRPHMYTKVILKSSKDQTVLMQNLVNYNPFYMASQDANVSIPPDPQYSWPKFDDVVAQPDVAIAAMEEAVSKSVDAIVTLLK